MQKCQLATKNCTATAAIPSTIAAKAKPMSRPLMPAALGAGRDGADAVGAAGAGFEAAAAGAAAAALAAGAAAATGAAGDGTAGAAGAATGAGEGAAAAGTRIDGPPAGFGGRLMRTVCFFWAEASGALGGSGAAGGVTGGVFSDIGLGDQTLGIGFRSVNGIVPGSSSESPVSLDASFNSRRLRSRLPGCIQNPSS